MTKAEQIIHAISVAQTVETILEHVACLSAHYYDFDIDQDEYAQIIAYAASRLVFDCPVDLTPYSEGDQC